MDPAEYPVRRARPDEAAALAEFAARTFGDAFGADNRPEDLAAHLVASYGPAQQARELADPGYVTLVVDGPAGYAAFAQVRQAEAPPCVTDPGPVELYRFYVDRPWHGRGVAQRLMDAVRGAAAALGARSVWLSVWERNPRGIAFYAKSGFRDVGTKDFYVGPDRQTDRVMVATVGGTVPSPAG